MAPRPQVLRRDVRSWELVIILPPWLEMHAEQLENTEREYSLEFYIMLMYTSQAEIVSCYQIGARAKD